MSPTEPKVAVPQQPSRTRSVEKQQLWMTMTATHGTRHRYVNGCRCDDCKAANREYERDRRARRASGEVPRCTAVVSLPAQPVLEASVPGRVEAAVALEVGGLPAAAKVLAGLLDTLHKGSARSRRGGLAVVRTMAKAGTTDAGDGAV